MGGARSQTPEQNNCLKSVIIKFLHNNKNNVLYGTEGMVLNKHINTVHATLGLTGSGRREAKGEREGFEWRDIIANSNPLFEHTILH